MPPRKFLIEDIQARLIVQAEGAIIEICGADRNQKIISYQHLDVIHRRLVFVNLGAGGEQIAP